MKIAIVGAGVAGVTTAYELARHGHTVTVFERRASAAEETSFAPGAVRGLGPLAPWALPGSMGVPRALGSSANIQAGRASSLAQLRWLWQWRGAARKALRSEEPTPAMRALAQLSQWSQHCYLDTAEALELDLEHSCGALLLLRDDRTAAPLRQAVQALRSAGALLHELDAAAARKLEPGLAENAEFALALHLPAAEAGNCRQFSVLLRQAAQRLGAEFLFQAEVTAIRSTSNGTTLQLRGEAEPRRFEAAVLCSGADALSLLAPLGVRTGMVALWGYSLTAPLREGVPGPQGTVLDAARQVSLARLGQRIRVSGGAELGGTGAAQRPKALHALYEALDTWFPGSAQRGAGLQMWRGARAIRPSGLPLLGASGVPGLWLNLAHGDGGWSLASGCARELAQQLVGSESALTPTDLLHFAPSGA